MFVSEGLLLQQHAMIQYNPMLLQRRHFEYSKCKLNFSASVENTNNEFSMIVYYSGIKNRILFCDFPTKNQKFQYDYDE